MATQQELDKCYMTTACAHAELSKATRLKVGATLVTKTGVTISGVNGMPKQLGNECEVVTHREWSFDKAEYVNVTTETRQETIHAELNAILKCAREGVSCVGSILYTTHSCCVPCSSMLIAAGVSEVVYAEEFRDVRGLDLLKQAGVVVRKYEQLQ